MTTPPPFEVTGPLYDQGSEAEAIMRTLPAWFGIESSILENAKAADGQPTFVAAADGSTIGFLTLRPTSPVAIELHAMGVLGAWHRRGVGRALVGRAAAHARVAGTRLLHVKTLAPDHPDPGYAATRSFYQALGFLPLEIVPQVWGTENPCLMLVLPLTA